MAVVFLKGEVMGRKEGCCCMGGSHVRGTLKGAQEAGQVDGGPGV